MRINGIIKRPDDGGIVTPLGTNGEDCFFDNAKSEMVFKTTVV